MKLAKERSWLLRCTCPWHICVVYVHVHVRLMCAGAVFACGFDALVPGICVHVCVYVHVHVRLMCAGAICAYHFDALVPGICVYVCL
jgi:hypothetical protein